MWTWLLFGARGFGFLVPVLPFAALIASQAGFNALYGDGFYEAHDWTKVAPVMLAGLVLIELDRRSPWTPTDDRQRWRRALGGARHTFLFVGIRPWGWFWMCVGALGPFLLG